MRDPVRGHAYVVACSRWGEPAVASNVAMNLVVSAEGVPGIAIEHECLCRHDRWPWAGQTLPVIVDRAEPARLRVQWDEVPAHHDTARREADALAAALRRAG